MIEFVRLTQTNDQTSKIKSILQIPLTWIDVRLRNSVHCFSTLKIIIIFKLRDRVGKSLKFPFSRLPARFTTKCEFCESKVLLFDEIEIVLKTPSETGVEIGRSWGLKLEG